MGTRTNLTSKIKHRFLHIMNMKSILIVIYSKTLHSIRTFLEEITAFIEVYLIKEYHLPSR